MLSKKKTKLTNHSKMGSTCVVVFQQHCHPMSVDPTHHSNELDKTITSIIFEAKAYTGVGMVNQPSNLLRSPVLRIRKISNYLQKYYLAGPATPRSLFLSIVCLFPLPLFLLPVRRQPVVILTPKIIYILYIFLYYGILVPSFNFNFCNLLKSHI